MTFSKTIYAVLLSSALIFTACNDKSATTANEVASKTTEVVKDVASKATEKVAKTAEVAVEKVAETVKKEVEGDVAANDEILIFQVDNSDGKITLETIQKGFEDAGFYMAAINDMNNPYMRDFNNTTYDVYALADFYNKDIVEEFIKEYPTIGLFAPIPMSIYTKKGDKTISISTLSTKKMAEITGIPADHKAWKKLDDMIEKALKLALPNGKVIPYTNKTIKVDGPLVVEATSTMTDEWEDELEDFQLKFESLMTVNKFAMPAFNEFTDEMEDTGYDFYSVYSICKIPVAYTVSKNYPEMGAYGPCSLYIYKKEGDDTVHYGIHHVNNWIHSMGITEKESVDILQDAMAKVEELLAGITKSK